MQPQHITHYSWMNRSYPDSLVCDRSVESPRQTLKLFSLILSDPSSPVVTMVVHSPKDSPSRDVFGTNRKGWWLSDFELNDSPSTRHRTGRNRVEKPRITFMKPFERRIGSVVQEKETTLRALIRQHRKSRLSSFHPDTRLRVPF